MEYRLLKNSLQRQHGIPPNSEQPRRLAAPPDNRFEVFDDRPVRQRDLGAPLFFVTIKWAKSRGPWFGRPRPTGRVPAGYVDGLLIAVDSGYW
jgi:hypothetical protein